MHILVINDDGPPSNQSSPYVHPFVHYLQQAGHLCSVILPHQQRSWIGKAHFVGQVTKPTYFHPGTIHEDDGTTHQKPTSKVDQEEWVLVDGTPATCAQLGLHHFFQDRPAVDLVVSGPNYGRNSTSLFSLSSGTIGGAMEAAVCRKRAIALSFAFWSRDHQPDLIAGACKHSIRLIEYLANNWGDGADLYSINVPVVEGIGREKVMYTHALQNYWTSGSSFEEVAAEDEADPQVREKEIRETGEAGDNVDGGDRDLGTNDSKSSKHRWFKWAPKFGDIQKSIDASTPGNDGWAIHQGYTSVTPLKASYMHATDVPLGELKLPPTNVSTTLALRSVPIFGNISSDFYSMPLINRAFQLSAPHLQITNIPHAKRMPTSERPFLQILPYEDINFDHHLEHPTSSLANSYIIRKALIRKNYLWNTISGWWSKHPSDTALKGHVPLTLTFELDFAEFLDDALVECFELHESFEKEEREWWVLKPAMSDQGQGVRLFSSFGELQAIFDEWEPPSDDEEDDVSEDPPEINGQDRIGAGTMTSQLRHFVAQRYIDPPLLFPEHGNRKFHIRTYVLAVGALKVYVYREMLALFAPEPYISPSSTDPAGSINARVHLTNTCLHASGAPNPEASVLNYWTLPSQPPSSDPKHPNTSWKQAAFAQICAATGTLFKAAAREQMIHFQTLPNSFEVFGVDWLVDADGDVWLLEVNAFPDFKQSGDELKEVIEGLWEGVVRCAVVPFFGGGKEEVVDDDGKMVSVLEVDLGRR